VQASATLPQSGERGRAKRLGVASTIDQHDETAAAVLANLTETILVLDRTGYIRWAAPSVSRYGLTPDECVGRNAAAQFHADDSGRFAAGLADALASPGRAVCVGPLAPRPVGGSVVPTEGTFRFLPNVAGIHGVVLVLRDMSERMWGETPRPYDGLSHKDVEWSARSNKRESEEQLRQLVRLSHIGIFDHNHLTGEFYWSQELRKIFGWGPDEPVVFAGPPGKGWQSWNLIHPLDRERAAAGVRRAHSPAGDGILDMEYRIVRRDGTTRWIAMRSQTFFEGKGTELHPARTVGALQDVTQEKEAQRQLQLTQNSVDKCNVAIYWVNASGQVTYANECACKSLGLTPRELFGLHIWDFNPDFTAEHWPALWHDLKCEATIRVETRHRRKDGTTFPVETIGSYLMADGEEQSFVFAQDITERQHAERGRLLMHAAIEASRTPFYSLTPDAKIVYANEHACRMLGYTREELVGRYVWDIDPYYGPEDQPAFWAKMKAQGMLRFETQHRRVDGTTVPVEVTANFFSYKGEEFSLAFVTDITERLKATEALTHSLHEKETLLREVHHRVKNNLQIIASLLHFQAKNVRDPEDFSAFEDGRNRLRSMILVHEKLYQSASLSRIDFGSYLRALARDLQRSYSARAPHVDMHVTAEELALPVESALPCGMILCELLTNVFKYAFPDGRSGRADISLRTLDGRVHLGVSDNGVGLPEQFDPDHSPSFGWQLVRKLTAQLGGTASVSRRGGTQVIISFPNPAVGS
jgi:PAS domain S-box-containing protein